LALAYTLALGEALAEPNIQKRWAGAKPLLWAGLI